jgi:hypothetical protein
LTVRNPREENRPEGYPIANKAFRDAAENVIAASKDGAEQARRFQRKLGQALRNGSHRRPSAIGDK